MQENLPRDESYDENYDENYEAALDEAIGEALEGDMRAAEWRQLKNALLRRRDMLKEALDLTTDEDERKKLEAELSQTDEHIAVLSEEEGITQFVEDSVKFSSEVRRLHQG